MTRFTWLSLKRPGPNFTWIRKAVKGLRQGSRAARAKAAAWVILSVFAAAPVRAQHLIAWPIGRPPPIVIPPTPGPIPLPMPLPRPDVRPLPLGGEKLEGRVTSQVATLWIEVTFRNDTAQRLEGDLFMPIPADAVIDKLEMRLGDKILKAELLDADRARATYENIVRQMRDPALLELVGERMVRARVFPIEPNSTVTLRFNTTQILPKAGGLYSLRVPMAKVGGLTNRQSVKLDLAFEKPIRLLYSPTHSAEIERKDKSNATVRFEGTSPGDLVVLYSLDEGELATSLISHREDGEDGSFMLSLAPRADAEGRPTPKDVVFVVDRSGSMEDEGRMDQARKALLYMLSRLDPGDRFGVVDFATGVSSFETGLSIASPEAKRRAKAYIQKLEASGGTNIEGALDEAVRMLNGKGRERVPMLVFLTDGLPTVGETNTENLLRRIHAANKGVQARFFCLGAGADVNSLFLDKLAETQRGGHDYVLPGEDIEVKVGQLYDRIAKPALADVKLEWDGVEVKQVYPKRVTDIFYGDPLVLVGRYDKAGKGRLVLTAKSGGKDVRFEFPVDLPRKSDKHPYLPKMWAHRKVAHLLDEVRLAGGAPNPEVVTEVTKLAKRYGIVTPYTSLFIAEEKDMAALRRDAAPAMEAMAFDAAASGSPRASRGHAISRMLNAAKAGFGGGGSMMVGAAEGPAAPKPAMAPMSAALGDEFREEREQEKKALSKMKEVGGKTFYRKNEGWVDGETLSDDKKDADAIEIEFLSDAYFKLLRDHPQAKAFMALGKDVTFAVAGKTYRIVEKK